MTTIQLSVLMHYRIHTTLYPEIGETTIYAAHSWLRDEGLIKLIKKDSGEIGYAITNRGDAHVMQIMDLPLPRRAWVDENCNTLIVE